MMSRFALVGRQWRRALFGTGLLFLFMVITVQTGALDIDTEILTGPIGWISMFLAGLIIASALVFTFALIVPALLTLVELWGITLVITAALSPLWNALQLQFGLPAWLDCVYLIAIFLTVHWGLYGDWQTRFRKGAARVTRRQVNLKAAPEAVWRALRPNPDRAADYYWPGVTYLPVPEGEEADYLMLLPRRAGLKDATSFVSVTDEVRGQSFTFQSQPAVPDEAETPAVVMQFSLEPHKNGGTRLSVSETVSRHTFGQNLNWWLSNDLADHLSCIQARVDGRRDGSIHGHQMLKTSQIGSMSPPARPA